MTGAFSSAFFAMLETDPIKLECQRVTLIRYLNMKLVQEDWHGVCDAANDLRDIETSILYLKELKRLCPLS